jgi:hypothetical protein
MRKKIRSSGREKQILPTESFLKAHIFVLKLDVMFFEFIRFLSDDFARFRYAAPRPPIGRQSNSLVDALDARTISSV